MTTIILDIEKKSDLNKVLSFIKELGLSFKKSEGTVKENLPNRTTLKAFKDSEQGKNMTKFDNAEEMFKHLGV